MKHTPLRSSQIFHTTNAKPADRRALYSLIDSISEFSSSEKKVACDLIRLALKDSRKHGYHVLVAKHNQHIVGYVCFGPTPLTKTTYDLYWLAVHPKFQGQGIARQLLNSLIATLQPKGALVLRAETSGTPHYRRTRTVYQKLGFKEVGRIKHFYQKGDDLFTFALSLS